MIQLTKDLVMIADDHCYTIGEPRQKADKGIVLDKPTYHTTAGQAVSAAVSRAMRAAVKDGRITTLNGFIREQERLQAEFEKLVAQLDGGE